MTRPPPTVIVGAAYSLRSRRRCGELCRAAGISFRFAFPHAHGPSFPAFIGKLGYQHLSELVEYQLPIGTVWAERIRDRARAARSLYERYQAREGTLRPFQVRLSMLWTR